MKKGGSKKAKASIDSIEEDSSFLQKNTKISLNLN